jgi:hypothetical protein
VSKFRAKSSFRNNLSEHEITEIVSVPARYTLVNHKGIRYTVCESATALGARFYQPNIPKRRTSLRTEE